MTALRCSTALAIVLLGSIAMNQTGAGVLACLGALYAGMVSFSGPYPDRIRRMIGLSLALGAVTFVGSHLSIYPIARIVVVGIAAFAMAIYSTRSTAANSVSIQVTAVLVVLSGIPATAQNPLGNALAVLIGGLVQTAVLMAVSPFWPHSQERRVVSTALESLATYVGRLAGQSIESPIPDGQPFQDAWALIADAEVHGLTSERRYLKEELRHAERLRAELVGLGRAYDALIEAGEPLDAPKEALSRLQQSLGSLADSVQSGMPVKAPIQITKNQNRESAFWHWLEYVEEGIAAAMDLSPAQFSPEPRRLEPSKTLSESEQPKRVWLPIPTTRALWDLMSRHAGRYAACVAAATALSELWKTHHSYWLPLTACLILRPDYATTLNRGMARVVGTLFGVLLAGIFAFVVHAGAWVLPVDMIVAGWLACALYQANYVLYAASITLYVVFSVSASGIPERSAAMERLMATSAGVVVCLAVSILWPIWESKKIKAVLKDALEAQVVYGKDVSRHIGSTVSEETDASRRQARALRIEAERVVNAGAIEPFWGRKHSHQRAQEFMAEIDENAARLLALQAEAAETSGVDDAKVADLRARIAAALAQSEELIQSLTELRPTEKIGSLSADRTT